MAYLSQNHPELSMGTLILAALKTPVAHIYLITLEKGGKKSKSRYLHDSSTRQITSTNHTAT